jgi:hypothetical protein
LLISVADTSTQVTWSGKSAKLVGKPGDTAKVRRHKLKDSLTVVTVEFITPDPTSSEETK